jgi:peptidoglycan hydrolase-like protein with peptidoglycan-binding domain
MTRTRFWLLLLTIGAVVVLAACSSDTSSSDPVPATTTSTEIDTSSSQSHAIVEEMQTSLADLGYYEGDIDGLYGPKTIAAVKTFQAQAGLTADGKYGPKTHDALAEANGNDPATNVVREIQVELRSLGLYDGEIDGLYGTETADAIMKAQEACAIEPDGIYGPETHDCLLDLLVQD